MVDASDLAVVGLVEVLSHFPKLYNILARMRRVVREQQPDLLILIDYPDFNLRLAKSAKAAGVKVLYYISPQIWAWRPKRIDEIAKRIDMMAVVFPFEVPFYERAGIPVRFVGHPLVDSVQRSSDSKSYKRALGMDEERPVLGLLPGSRRGEIKRLLPAMLAAARLLCGRIPGLQVVLAQASTLNQSDIQPYLHESATEVNVVSDRFHGVLGACDAVVTASGTATLEAALMGVPMVIVYRMSPLTYPIIRRLVTVDHIGLCNIVAGETIVPELIQRDVTPERIAKELFPLLTDPTHAAAVRASLAGVRTKLGEGGGAANVARLVLEVLDTN
jgi:lipid-A-disaccharide synthase